MCQQRAFDTGEIIWRPGDPGVDMLVLITGRLHVTNEDGKLIGQVLPGASFGEMACLTGHKRFVGFEAVFGKRALPQHEGLAHTVGFMVLLALIIYVNLQDFINPINLPR
ncbi:MAG: cyclic nucleotide-binding domain-containing protein [Nitrospirae bacterium]|nr:cyclic nucleotide-binding domain-containing protein [Nitrospirota bacterium]